MTYATVPNIMWVMQSPRAAFRAADAVVRLRISASHGALPWTGDRDCGLAGVEHEAEVLDAVKHHPALGPAGATLRFVRYPVGSWTAGQMRPAGYVPLIEFDPAPPHGIIGIAPR